MKKPEWIEVRLSLLDGIQTVARRFPSTWEARAFADDLEEVAKRHGVGIDCDVVADNLILQQVHLRGTAAR